MAESSTQSGSRARRPAARALPSSMNATTASSWRHCPDRAELVDRAQRDHPGADELLGVFGQLEHLDARGDARLRPAERLGGAVLCQAAVEHRLDRARLLVGVELLAGD
jgi:hypothetical protein